MSTDPRRLMDDPSVEVILRDDLQAAWETTPSIDLDSGAQRLEASIASGALPSYGSIELPPSSAGWSTKLWMVSAVVVGIGGGAMLIARTGGPSSQEHARTRSEAVAAAGASVAKGAPSPIAAAITTTQNDDEPAQVEPGARHVRPAKNAGDALQEEMALLVEARGALNRTPARALALAEEGHRRFGRGMFYEEREAIALSSLFAMGRREEGERRANAFLRRYAQSPYRERIEHARAAHTNL